MSLDDLDLDLDLDIAPFRRALSEAGQAFRAVAGRMKAELASLVQGQRQAGQAARDMGSAMARALTDAAVRGRDFKQVLADLLVDLAEIAFKNFSGGAGTPLAPGGAPAGNPVSSPTSPLMALGTTALKLLPALFAEKGAAISQGRPLPFADGGIVRGPTAFPLAGGQVGVMGEAGAEAILPLRRGSDGKLGVAAGGGGRNVTVNVAISTPDVEGFRRSESQVAATLRRALARGNRNL